MGIKKEKNYIINEDSIKSKWIHPSNALIKMKMEGDKMG